MMNDRTRDLVLGTAGHIDHGKTALVRALTGVDTDRLPAEKQRGITIDLGFAALPLGEFRLAIIDVPGHERFIRNMLAGATGLDLAMLVVAADDSVMPQTREHLEILRLLGLSGGLVVLTKCDLADPTWIELVEEDVRALIRGTFLEGASIVRTSVVNGQGLDDLKRELHSLCGTIKPGQDSGVFRMAIDRSFTVAGHGTVVTGTVASGRVAVGDELEWHPSGRVVRVRGLHQHDQPVDRIGRGSRAAINLVGVHHAELHRGQELAAPGYLQSSPDPRGRSGRIRRGRASPASPRALQAPPGNSRGIGRPVAPREQPGGTWHTSACPAIRRRADCRGVWSTVRAPRRESAGDAGGWAGHSADGRDATVAATIRPSSDSANSLRTTRSNAWARL